jgi:hypothetical protein
VRRKDDIDETLIGKSMADDQETSEIFIHACERHIKNIDTEVLRRYLDQLSGVQACTVFTCDVM